MPGDCSCHCFSTGSIPSLSLFIISTAMRSIPCGYLWHAVYHPKCRNRSAARRIAPAQDEPSMQCPQATSASASCEACARSWLPGLPPPPPAIGCCAVLLFRAASSCDNQGARGGGGEGMRRRGKSILFQLYRSDIIHTFADVHNAYMNMHDVCIRRL